MPYSSQASAFKANPGAAAYLAARSYRITGYSAVPNNLADMKALLNANRPFIVWINAASNFPEVREDKAPQPEEIPMLPSPEGQVTGHFLLVLGYSDRKRAFLVLNSHGPNWGKDGYAYLPYGDFKDPSKAIPEYTISGISVSATTPAMIGSPGDLVSRPGRDQARGQIHIDATAATTAGTATSFDFFSDASAGAEVTPLLFSYDAKAGTYTMTGIGRSIASSAVGSQGIPFDVVDGSARVTTSTVFGFYDGKLKVTRTEDGDRSFTLGGANAGVVPYDDGSAGTTTWLTTAGATPKGLTIGATFSTDAAGNQSRLDSTSSNRVYSAMLVE